MRAKQRMRPILVLAGLCSLPWLACSSDEPEPESSWPAEYGAAPTEALQAVEDPEGGKSDTAGAAGPQVAWDNSNYSVWKPTRQWTDVSAEAGLAWGASSGLNWEQKFSAWVASLPKIPAAGGYTTFQLQNPQGIVLPAPVLECAETAIFLRATFAAWYRLPFFMEAADRQGRLFLGHFGFRRLNGTIYNSSPLYQTLYKDYTTSWRTGQPWPSDAKLAARGLYGGGDEVPFLEPVNGKPALAGAYFDRLFLDKRVGHFMLVVLAWFGSMHLADPINMYHLKPEAIRPGDVLIERWQRQGIGHTIPVMQVTRLTEDRFEVAVATGSMPRRQPVWEEGNDVVWYFTNEYMGGPGTNDRGEAYAALGGGLKRWRVALRAGAQYKNTWLPGDQANWINSTNLEALAARPARFEALLGEMTPEVQRDLALSRITAAREHLMNHPSSCSARTRREDAFEELYQVMATSFRMDQQQVDAQYRTREDYLFAELKYDASRTCCWNSTTRAMYDIILAYDAAQQEQAGEACVAPTVFMGRDWSATQDGYQLFRQYAEELGRSAEWVAWSADEPCPPARTVNDVEVEHGWTPWCELDPREASELQCNAAHRSLDLAAPLTLGEPIRGRLCTGEDHWYAFKLNNAASAKVVLSFSNAEGDLDLELNDTQGGVLGSSAGVSDVESIAAQLPAGDYRIHVFGYSGAAARYQLLVTAE